MPRKHDPSIQLSGAHRGSQRLTQQSQSLHGSSAYTLQWYNLFCGTHNRGNGVFLTLSPALGTVFLVLGRLTSLDVRVYA